MFDRRDAIVAPALGVAATALYLSTVSSQVAFGDAPESVLGVRTLGILHAPGYPAYVLAARAFASIVPIGGWALRVNLFSVACAALTVVVTYLLARCFGASPTGAAIGSASLAVTASFWFNAVFAKHYTFSALVVATAALFVAIWWRGGRSTMLIIAAAFVGLGVGSAWQIAVIMALGLVALIAMGPRHPDARTIAVASGAFGCVALVVWGFVVVRAHQDPLLNWGDATSLGRLVALIKQTDFAAAPVRGVSVGRVGAAVGGLERDFGIVAIALAVAGVVRAWRRGERSVLAVLAAITLMNVVAVIVFAGYDVIEGFGTVVAQGGYLLGAMIAIAVFVALGATAAIEAVAAHARGRRILAPAAAALLAVAVVVPSLAVHHKYADQRGPAYADAYGHRVLASLPPQSVLLVWGEEFSSLFLYRQEFDRERPDVSVISINSIGLDWASARLARRYDLGAALQARGETQQILDVVATFRERGRPVFLDVNAMYALSGLLGYRTHGLVAEVVDKKVGPQPVADVSATSAALDRAAADDGLVGRPSNRIPSRSIFFFYERAHIELAKLYALRGDLEGTRTEMRRAVETFPYDKATRPILAALLQPGGRDSLPLLKDL